MVAEWAEWEVAAAWEAEAISLPATRVELQQRVRLA